MVGCTEDVDARDNTGTNTNIDGTGVPIYWLNGSKAADDNADFYDGDWDDEVNDKNESGTDGPITSQTANYPFTGCEHDGTEAFFGISSSRALGVSEVRIGTPNNFSANHGPLSSNEATISSDSRPMYGLSQVFEVLATTLVSNTHLTPGIASSAQFQAQSFETGPNAGGYTVSEVDMRLGTASGRSARVSIRDDDTGKPGDLVATLTNPGTLTADSLNTFTPPAGTTLAASTTYWITVNEGISSNRAEFRIVSQNGQTGETGWNIGDSSLRRVSEADIWSTSTSSLLMAIKGTAIPTISLVSNTHLSTSLNTNHVLAQSFETGANLDGYTVSQVDIRFGFTSGKSTTVKIRKNNADNQPGNLVTTLTNPGTLTADSLNTFTAPAGTTLDARTTYWISVNEGFFSIDRASVHTDAGNDQTGETGWSIGDDRLFRNNETNDWQTSTSSMLMTIKGTVVPCDGIWCATLTVQDLGDGHRGCGNASDGNECSVAAHLSEDEFTHAMTDYSVGAARVQSDGQLQLYLNRDITTDSQSLVLHVGSETFAFEDANVKGSDHHKWNNSGLSWTTGDAIGLKLTDATNAMGNPTISGVPQVDMMLTADTSAIEDVDGLPATFTYQWVWIATDSTETNLGTNSTYTVSSSDVGSTIRVDVRFTDLAGNSEGPLPSEATAAVVPAAAPCPTGNDWCATMTVGTLEAGGTFYGFSPNYGRLDDPTIDYGPSFEVDEIYIYQADGFGQDRISVILDAYLPRGTVFNLGGTEFTSDAGRTTTAGVYIWSRPANFAWIDGQEVRVSANLAPAPESATVDGTTLVLTHSEDLDTGSVPPASAYTVRVEPNGTMPSSVSVGTRTVTLTLATPVIDGQVVTVSYDMPASNRLQDVSGRNAPAFNNFAVTNNTEAGNSAPTFTEGETTSRSFDETIGDATATTATNIGEPVAAMDLDTGDTLTYTLEGTDSVKFAIVSTSGQLLTKVGTEYDYEQQRTYSVTVVVEDSDDNSAEIMVTLSVIDQNEPPLAPTPVFVSPTSGSASKLNVSWNRPTNTGRPSINNYDIQYREVDAANYSNGPQNVSGSRTTISGLRPSTVYQVQVRATNAEGDGVWSPAVERSTSQNSEPDPPAVTYGLRATGVSQTRIDLSWNAPTDDGGASITGYRIEVSDNGGLTWSDLVANTRSSSRTYAHTGLTAGVTRHYRVSAINRVGTGLRSTVASGQTQAANAKPKRPSTMYLYFTVSNSDWNESEEVKYSGNRIDGDCSGEKYFRAFWTEPNSPPVDEWEVQATPFDGASGPSTQMRYSRGNREYPEFIGSAQFATGSGEGSYINFAVRGRYGDTWGAWGPTSVLRCNNTE